MTRQELPKSPPTQARVVFPNWNKDVTNAKLNNRGAARNRAHPGSKESLEPVV